MRTILPLPAGLLFIGLFVARADHFARSASQTFDEGAHLVAGLSYWRTGTFRINPEHPPLLKLLWSIPIALRSDVQFEPDPDAWEKKDHWILADDFLYSGRPDHFELLVSARRVNIALGATLVALIGWWAYRLWGRGAGLLACALAATDPNLAAFAALLSMDLGLALFGTAAAYALWEYAVSGRRGWFLAAGVFIGLALAAKFSAVLFLADLAVGAIGYVVAGGTLAVPGSAIGPSRRERLSALPAAAVRLGLIAAIVVVLIYFGIRAIDWPRGLKQQLARDVLGDPHFYLNGEISTTGWWEYFLWVLAIKTPPATLILAAASVAMMRAGQVFMRRDVWFLLVPAIVYFVAVSASRIDIGWRVILPAYPALILLAARAATIVPKGGASRIAGWAVLIGLVLPVVTDLRHLGKELSYANGLFVGRDDLHRYLGDANIDWGQGLKALRAELAGHGDPMIYFSYAGTARPEAYGIHYQRLPGWGQFRPPPGGRVQRAGRVLVAVSVSNLQGTYLHDPTTFRWLLDRPPLSRTDGSIWVWDLTGDLEAISRLRE
ncbi:MAG TPA: phospholipid carrier-dependent glycosyltransferase [Gemmataceae bacterium]|nr:phospholipid carrier-dependent glycosyltransferase [Gemmataceae bacterium]